MKMALLIAASALISTAPLRVALGASPSSQDTASAIHNVPSTKAAQKMIMGEWSNMIGPNPFVTRMTQNKLWNSQCWSRYTIFGVRLGKANKSNAYVVEIKFTSSGGTQDCGHRNKPTYSIALIPADGVISGKASTIWWLDCRSEKEFRVALQYQDPRSANALCSTYVSDRVHG